MGKIIQLTGKLRPSKMMKSMLKHSGDVSEGYTVNIDETTTC